MTWYSRMLNPLTQYSMRPSATRTEWAEEDASRLYAILRSYYFSNDLYTDIQAALYERAIATEALKGLRNPAHRVVEFYAAKLWPGQLPDALPIVTANDAIIEPIEQVWAWSNWSAKKQLAARQFAMLGDLFIKVVQSDNEKRVQFELVDPSNVREFETDNRGFVTGIRIDIPVDITSGGRTKTVTHVESWDKVAYRTWETEHPDRDLGTPLVQRPITDFGIDFVPVVHAMFRDVGEPRGLGAFTPALDKIDEANRMATRLHQMLFRHNKPLWALQANGVTSDGRPLPPPNIAGTTPGQRGTLTVGDEDVVSLPGMATLVSLVPQLDYSAALAILTAHMGELEQDLPELAYYKLRDVGNVSGRALQLLLTAAIDRVLEARGNAEAALVRADSMALTIGQHLGLFANLGSFEAGHFAHSFEAREVLVPPRIEQAEADKAEADALLVQRQLGVSTNRAQRILGYTDEEIAQMAAENTADAEASIVASARAFDRGAGATA